ncbi:MAG: type II toxin-antitoxin system PemK/MazF family toxin [Bacteroidetes bacterium]|nr:MAG: type II toxin-antitoxin system PemK/MazF family toxin [Bacteroidota bacterium]
MGASTAKPVGSWRYQQLVAIFSNIFSFYRSSVNLHRSQDQSSLTNGEIECTRQTQTKKITANVINSKRGEIWLVNLPKNIGFPLHGPHRCIVNKKFGSTVQIVPISENRNNTLYAKIPIDRSKCNLRKDSKIKVCQYTSATIENFKYIKAKQIKQH